MLGLITIGLIGGILILFFGWLALLVVIAYFALRVIYNWMMEG